MCLKLSRSPSLWLVLSLCVTAALGPTFQIIAACSNTVCLSSLQIVAVVLVLILWQQSFTQ